MKYINRNNEVIYTGTLEENKNDAMIAVTEAFNLLATTNSFMSSLGFPIDNRWVGKNDIDNMTCSLDVWFEHYPQVGYRDSNNITHLITKEQLIILKKEAQFNRIQKFSAKWFREQMIMGISSIQKIWVFVEASDEWILQQNGMV